MKDSFKPTGQMAIAILAAATKQQNQGIKLAKSGNVEAAISAFRKALELDPNINLYSTEKTEETDPESFAKKLAVSTKKIDEGTKLAKSGNVGKAIFAFQKALELDPNINLDLTEKTQEKDPQSFAKKLAAPTKIDRGTELAKFGNVEAAISAFKKALELNPNINLDLTEKTQEKDPQSFARKLAASTKIDRGTELAKSGNVEAAISAFRKALELNPKTNLDLTEKTQEKDPQSFARKLAASTKINRGTELAKSGNVEAATYAFRKALELNPKTNLDLTEKTQEKDPQSFARKLAASQKIEEGTKLGKFGKSEEAVAILREALKWNPEIDIYQHLSQFNGGLSQWADQVYNSLEEKEKPVALRIFLELVEIENETTNSGKVNYQSRLAFLEDLPNPEQSLELLLQVTGKLADQKNRLISIQLSPGETILSITYKPLLDSWITFQKWLKDYQPVIEITREIEKVAKRWKNDQANDDWLWRGTQLVEAENYLKEHGHLGLLKGFGYEFLEASKEFKQKKIEE